MTIRAPAVPLYWVSHIYFWQPRLRSTLILRTFPTIGQLDDETYLLALSERSKLASTPRLLPRNISGDMAALICFWTSSARTSNCGWVYGLCRSQTFGECDTRHDTWHAGNIASSTGTACFNVNYALVEITTCSCPCWAEKQAFGRKKVGNARLF